MEEKKIKLADVSKETKNLIIRIISYGYLAICAVGIIIRLLNLAKGISNDAVDAMFDVCLAMYLFTLYKIEGKKWLMILAFVAIGLFAFKMVMYAIYA